MDVPDSGVNLLASATNFLMGDLSVSDLATSRVKRLGVEKHITTCLTNAKITKFPVYKIKRKSRGNTTASIELACICSMPLHWHPGHIVREVDDDDVINCDVCNSKFHPFCVNFEADYNYTCLSCEESALI